MATAAMQVAAHQMPPMPLPRIRPPRMLPGTPSPNTNPQPSGSVPTNKVWVQGEWRDPRSKAAKKIGEVESRRAERAARQETHGMNIYAYSNLRTNQVIYSLTKNLDNTNGMRQLMYHGKKTVPAGLRRDVWRPYYSIHFAQTPAGAKAGLLAYHRLRELSLQRQLSPPADLITTTQDDIDKMKAKIGSPLVVAEALREKRHDAKGDQRVKIPRLGQVLPKQHRAKKLMDQKRFSVADAAYVIAMLRQKGTLAEQLKNSQEEWQKWYQAKGYVGRKKVRAVQREVQAEKQKLLDRAARLETPGKLPGGLLLDKHVADRLSMEHDVPIAPNNQIPMSSSLTETARIRNSLSSRIESEIDEAQEKAVREAKDKPTVTDDKAATTHETLEQIRIRAKETYMAAAEADPDSSVAQLRLLDQDSEIVRVLWADTRNALYAETWPENVEHGWLTPRAVVSKRVTRVRQEEMTDDEGYEIAEQKETLTRFSRSSVHVMGVEMPYEGYTTHAKDIEEGERRRLEQLAAAQEQKKERLLAKAEAAEERKTRRLLAKIDAARAGTAAAKDDPIALEAARAETEQAQAELEAMKQRHQQVMGASSGQTTSEAISEADLDMDTTVRQQQQDQTTRGSSGEDDTRVEPEQRGLWGRVKGFFGR